MIDTVQQTVLVSAARDALSRAFRQALQTLIPTLVVVTSGTATGIELGAVATLAGMTILVSIVKSLLNLKVPVSAPAWAKAGERAVVAAAGTALGFFTIGGSEIATSVPWEATLTGTIGAALLALVMYFTNPPVIAGEIVGEVRDERISEGPQFVGGEELPQRSPGTTSIPIRYEDKK